jgi:hypothetical protein
MTGRPAGSRSFLRQIAEPIPRAVAPLVSRGRATGRRVAEESTLDLMPRILEVNETTEDAAPNNRNSAHSFTPPTTTQGEPRTATSSLPSTLQSNAGTDSSARRRRETESSAARTTHSVEPAAQSSPHESPPAYKQRSAQDSARRQVTTPDSFVQELASQPNRAITPSQVIASQPEHRSGTRVHIGTIEVRIPPPPAPTPHPAVKTTDAASRRGYGAPGRPTEPLARGLAWSHGLIQG